ncbi:hypothetical protein KAX97_15200 [candidate division WOR-3 bacterium]|nr:hypothetical protein [candidate division WOR-3 bacterium]
MKCEICMRRKATEAVWDEEIQHKYKICKKCRRAYYPTKEEKEKDATREEARAEFQAELDAGCYDLP